MLFLIPATVSSQSKPKRDVSKDKSVKIAKQRENAKKRTPANRNQRIKNNGVSVARNKNKKSAGPKTASYLRVNNQDYVYQVMSSYGESDTLKVSTDGKQWSVIWMPSWCEVAKYSDYFVITVGENKSHNEREDWCAVKSDNQTVKIRLKQLGAPLIISASIKNWSLEHNIKKDIGSGSGVTDCLNIYANVAIYGAAEQKCIVKALITDENDKPIKCSPEYQKYSTTKTNDVCAEVEVTPNFDSFEHKVSISIPNDAIILLKKKQNLRCKLVVYCVSTQKYIEGASCTFNFKAKKKKGHVKTEKL